MLNKPKISVLDKRCESQNMPLLSKPRDIFVHGTFDWTRQNRNCQLKSTKKIKSASLLRSFRYVQVF